VGLNQLSTIGVGETKFQYIDTGLWVWSSTKYF